MSKLSDIEEVYAEKLKAAGVGSLESLLKKWLFTQFYEEPKK